MQNRIIEWKEKKEKKEWSLKFNGQKTKTKQKKKI